MAVVCIGDFSRLVDRSITFKGKLYCTQLNCQQFVLRPVACSKARRRLRQCAPMVHPRIRADHPVLRCVQAQDIYFAYRRSPLWRPVLAIAYAWFAHAKSAPCSGCRLAIIVVFGGATLLLHDETFIKWKPSALPVHSVSPCYSGQVGTRTRLDSRAFQQA